jgi:pimeloyl-ACP methyl ester carboxylesterase
MERAERVDLPDVRLSVQVHGEGPVVIAAHGFPDEPGTFRGQLPALTAAGYRVVVPAMRGYAPSGEARGGRYDLAALGGDLLALAERYSPRHPVRILGHDWGAAAGYAAAALAPARVSHLAALAVPHPRAFVGALMTSRQARRSWYMAFFQLRGVADAAVGARDLALIERLWREWSPGYAATAAEMEAVKAALRGRVGAALGYYRAMAGGLADGAARRALLAPTTVPTLRLHGADDGCVGVEVTAREARWHPGGFELGVIAGAGHFLQREKPDEVAARLVGFFAR